MPSTHSCFAFAGFRLDAAEKVLYRKDQPVPLTPKAVETLLTLVERHGRLVTKEELIRCVWPDTFVEENNLAQNVSTLRRVLGEGDGGRPLIETVPRRGYRFVGRVEERAAETGLSGEATAAGPRSAAAAPEISAIAVLPFADMSSGRDQDYLCEGLAEELINALTQIDGLRVAARTASFHFREGADVRAVGERLGVGTLLSGSVRKAGDRLRVTVQLIETASGYQRWSRRYDRQLGDVFAIQDEIAESVATSLRGGVLSAREKELLPRPQTGPAAYEFYLRGRQLLPRLTQADLRASAGMFERAISLDAGYGPAWAGLATVHATLHEWFGASDDDLAEAERASDRALALAPGLADAHVARGCALSLSRRYDEAAREFEEATRINPNLFDAYYYFARTSFARGEIARSAELFGKAAEVRLEDFQSPVLQAQSLRMLGRGDEARHATQEGIARVERALELNPTDARALSLGSSELFDYGQPERALEWSRRSLELHPDDLSTLVNAACLRSKLGLKEEMLELLERVFARGWGKRDWIENDPDYDIVRDDPRFKKLLERLK
jgi:TolB-like protein/Flp pilus assembly protein TadD